MNIAAPDATLRFPFPEAPGPGEIHEIAPGVGWLRMPLPGPLNHINLWALRDGDDVTLVDTGMATDEIKDIWQEIFEGPLEGLNVTRVLCTHHHPDHMGLSGWLCKRTGAPLHVTKPEYETVKRWHTADPAESAKVMLNRLTRAGLDPEIANSFGRDRGQFKHLLGELPETAHFLDTSAPIEAAGVTWQVIVGRGHSPELVALYAPALDVLISSDQVLPKITPNISVQPHMPDANPLQQYLESLRLFLRLPAETLVLPSHRQPFYGLHARVDDITAHHVERLDTTRATCANGATAAEVMSALFLRRLSDPHQMFVALGETLAHINFLIAIGDMERDSSGATDIYRSK